MGLLDNLRGAVAAVTGVQSAAPVIVNYQSPLVQAVMGRSAERLYREQPNLRTVIDFLSKRTAQLGLLAFERVGDNDRHRLPGSDPLVALLRQPNPQMTTYDLVLALVGDLALYDEAVWIVAPDTTTPSGWIIRPVSPSWITARGGGSAFGFGWMEFLVPGSNRAPERVSVDSLLWFHGWSPGTYTEGASPVLALKHVLAEQVSASAYRQQIWARAGRFGGVLSRPADAPRWEPKTRRRFVEGWREYASDTGGKAGGTPILEDGMTYQRVGFSAKDEQFVEAAKLAFEVCCQVYHVQPVMVGATDSANYSNVAAYQRQLYQDTLGSTVKMIEDRINAFLVPKVSRNPDAYLEFNVDAAMRGNFEEQASSLSTATGRPFMTSNEARGRLNLPAVEGGDDLVTPLNVLVGGQASPTDAGTQNQNDGAGLVRLLAGLAQLTGAGSPSAGSKAAQRALAAGATPLVLKAAGPVTVKSADAADDWAATAEQALRKHFRRQRAAVLSALGADGTKAADDPEWWDAARWDRELTDDLFKLAKSAADAIGPTAAEALGFDPGDYDAVRTRAFLKAVARSRAGAINSTTRDAIQAAVDGDGDPAAVFDDAEVNRAAVGGVALATTIAAFAHVEAGKQLAQDTAVKTWETGVRPREDHAAMDGETVGIDEHFSNGADWPGDSVLGAAGVSNCNCGVSVTIP